MFTNPAVEPFLASGATLEELLDTMPCAVLGLDALGTIRQCNAPAAALWGVGQLLGQPLAQALPPARYPELHRLVRQAAASGQPALGEVPLPGSHRGVRLKVQPLAGGLLLYSEENQALKTSPRLPTEPELPHSQQVLQATLDSAADRIEVFRAVRDEQGAIVDFRWVLLNKVALRAHGQQRVGELLLAHNPGVVAAGIFQRFVQVVATGQPERNELAYQHEQADGWFDQLVVRLEDGVVVTSIDITARKAAQQQLIQAVLVAEEGEKRRIAESLHNGLAQLLYAAKLGLDQLASPAVLADGPAFLRARQRADKQLAAAIAQTRTLSHELMPKTLEDFGLEVAVQDICADFSVLPLRMRCRVEHLPALPPYLALALYRMAQELANNIVKHAQATQATIWLLGKPTAVELRADDNGVGIGLTASPASAKGMGLQALQDRVRLLNGTLSTQPGPGTHVCIRLPLPDVSPPPGV